MPMRILTVKQPWASLIIGGFKPVENRTWETKYRGDVAILAGKAIDTGERARVAFMLHLGKKPGGYNIDDGIKALPRGGVIGVAELHGITRSMDSWWFCGPVGLLLRNPRRTDKLVPMPGALCMFTAHDNDAAIIRARLLPAPKPTPDHD